MKKILFFVLILTLTVLLFCSCGEKADDYIAEIVIKNYGTITVHLDGDTAPITVNNFVKLAESGFYDGLTFHRIMEGFMMQGGDPNGDGTGGSPDNIKGEFSANGVENPISHKRGVISMARSGSQFEQYLSYGYTVEALAEATGLTIEEVENVLKAAYDSASSHFFIVHEDSTFLDGNYAAFGWVTEGMDIVDKICEEAQPTDNNGTISKNAQPIIETIRIVK